MNKKYNLQYVKNLCNKIGCELISTEYKNVKDNLKFRCPLCNCIYERNLDNLKNRKNPICNSCAMRKANSSKMPSYEEIVKVIEQDGNKLLSTSYLNCDTKLAIKCKCGNVFERTYYLYLKSNRSCGCDRQSNGSKIIEKILKNNKFDLLLL